MREQKLHLTATGEREGRQGQKLAVQFVRKLNSPYPLELMLGKK